MALILEIAKPREGALNSFEARDSISIAKVVFHSVLKSLDEMQKISSVDFRDSIVVSTELVKFLSLNTSFEAVEKLEIQNSSITGDLKQFSKYLQGVSKTTSSVGNKTDELKKVVEMLKKRIDKLEAKK